MVICLERGADLHMAQLIPLPLTVSCISKIQIGFTFLVPANPGSPGKRAVKRVCVCVWNDHWASCSSLCVCRFRRSTGISVLARRSLSGLTRRCVCAGSGGRLGSPCLPGGRCLDSHAVVCAGSGGRLGSPCLPGGRCLDSHVVVCVQVPEVDWDLRACQEVVVWTRTPSVAPTTAVSVNAATSSRMLSAVSQLYILLRSDCSSRVPLYIIVNIDS